MQQMRFYVFLRYKSENLMSDGSGYFEFKVGTNKTKILNMRKAQFGHASLSDILWVTLCFTRICNAKVRWK